MNKYELILSFSHPGNFHTAGFMKRMKNSNCHDALLGEGNTCQKRIGLYFLRDAESLESALNKALADTKEFSPELTLLEVKAKVIK
jgi:hypothetical protein